MNQPMPAIPRCPVTGLPATRRIQPISRMLIIGLWRSAFGVSADRLLAGISQFGLWESPCGLAFFEPMLAGDDTFYLDLYRRAGFHRALSAPRIPRVEFKRIAELVRPGDSILDVGCGEGALAGHVQQATYVGLDPHCHDAAVGPDIRNETVAEHAALHHEQYDVACASHAIEHVADPLGFARDLVRCVRPGGAVCLVVPSRTSAITRIPNFVLNAPPHHLSWWDENALREIAGRLDLVPETIETVPFSFDSMIYWMGRLAPKLTGDRYFRAHWTWYCALVWCWLVGRACDALFRVPASAEPSGLLLIARKSA
jgi:SAM-dependent methyltransferase